MKKNLIPITLIFMPYLILLLVVIMEETLLAMGLSLMIFVISAANLIYAFIFPGVSGSAVDPMKWCMIIKLTHIPFYILLFVIGLASWVSFFFLPVAAVVFLIDCMVLVSSSLYGIGGMIRLIKDKQMTVGKGILLSIAYFIFVIDLLLSITMFLSVRKATLNQETVSF